MRWMRLYQILNSGTNLREFNDYSWFKVQDSRFKRFLCFGYIDMFSCTAGVRLPQAEDHWATGRMIMKSTESISVLVLHNAKKYIDVSEDVTFFYSEQRMNCRFFRLQWTWKRQVRPKRLWTFTIRRVYNSEEVLWDKNNILKYSSHSFSYLCRDLPQFARSEAQVTVLFAVPLNYNCTKQLIQKATILLTEPKCINACVNTYPSPSIIKIIQ
jgi:hypothetical protein